MHLRVSPVFVGWNVSCMRVRELETGLLCQFGLHNYHSRPGAMKAFVLCVCFPAAVAWPSDVQLPLPRQVDLARLVRVRQW